MDTNQALNFLINHQPLPDDEELSEVLARTFEDVLQHFIEENDERCVSLILNAFGKWGGNGIYQSAIDTIGCYPESVVAPELLRALQHGKGGCRGMAAEIFSMLRPDCPGAGPVLQQLCENGSMHEKSQAIRALCGARIEGFDKVDYFRNRLAVEVDAWSYEAMLESLEVLGAPLKHLHLPPPSIWKTTELSTGLRIPLLDQLLESGVPLVAKRTVERSGGTSNFKDYFGVPGPNDQIVLRDMGESGVWIAEYKQGGIVDASLIKIQNQHVLNSCQSDSSLGQRAISLSQRHHLIESFIETQATIFVRRFSEGSGGCREEWRLNDDAGTATLAKISHNHGWVVLQSNGLISSLVESLAI